MSAIDHLLACTARIALPLAAICAACGSHLASAQTAPPAPPRLDRLPVPAPSAADIGAIASGYEAARMAGPGGGQPANQFLIMVSFSMPSTSLVRLAEQARRAGGLLVLNGLKDGSLTATAQAVHQTFGKQGAPLQIDPRLFTRYAVSTVPTFVLLTANVNERSCLTGACPTNGYAKASGDVSLDYALEQVANAQPAWRATANAILRRMGK